VLVDSSSTAPSGVGQITNVNGNVYFYGYDGTKNNLYETQGTGETLVASHVVPPTAIGGISTDAASDVIGNDVSDVVLRNGGGVVDWIMNNGNYQSGNVLTTAATGWDDHEQRRLSERQRSDHGRGRLDRGRHGGLHGQRHG
jgi:hypothetical protein